MKRYELTYLLSPDLSDEDIKNLSEKIKNFVQEEAGNIEKITEPSREKLGYPIKKKKEAFLITLNFSLNPEGLANLEKKLKSESQIFHYLILVKKRPEGIATKEALPRRKKLSRVTKRITEPKKAELEEIDKKIEEILNE